MTSETEALLDGPLHDLVSNDDAWRTILTPHVMKIIHENRQRQVIQYLDRYSTYEHCYRDPRKYCRECHENPSPDYSDEIRSYALYFPCPVVYSFGIRHSSLMGQRVILHRLHFQNVSLGNVLPNGGCFGAILSSSGAFEQMNRIWNSVFNNHLDQGYKSSLWWLSLVRHARNAGVMLSRLDGHAVFSYWESLNRDEVLTLASETR